MPRWPRRPAVSWSVSEIMVPAGPVLGTGETASHILSSNIEVLEPVQIRVTKLVKREQSTFKRVVKVRFHLKVGDISQRNQVNSMFETAECTQVTSSYFLRSC